MNKGVARFMGVLMGLAVLSAPAGAQDMSPEDAAKWVQHSTPGEAHKALNVYEGKWNENVTFWFEPGAEPTSSPCSSVAEWIMGGRFLVQTHRCEMLGQEFEGLGITGFDNYRQEYVTVWMDNLTTSMMVTRGTLDDATGTITMIGTADDFIGGRSDVPLRTVTKINPDGTSVYELYTQHTDGKEFKSLEVTARRAE